MQQILKFFIQNKVGILFLVLFCISIGLTIQAHSYHNSKWVSSTSFVSSFFLNIKYDITLYFKLESENKKLHQQNRFLQERQFNFERNGELPSLNDSIYQVINCHIISNSYDKTDNYVLVDVGTKDGVYEDFGVSLPNGIMGIVEKSTKNYSRVISILNTNLSINAKIKGSNQFGSLKWNGKSYQEMILEDLPRSAKFEIGDTVVTGNNSLIFPKDLPIGVIKSFELNVNAGYYYIEVLLFADMTNLDHAYVIIPNKIREAKKLMDKDE